MSFWRQFVQWLYDKTFGNVIKDVPDKKGIITNGVLYQLLIPLTTGGMGLYLSDTVYSTTSVSQAEKFSEATQIHYRQYVAEGHDCDEFSFALEGYWNDNLAQFAFGIVWSNTHAFNIMVDYENKIWIVEPQTNKFVSLDKIDEFPPQYKPPYRLILM